MNVVTYACLALYIELTSFDNNVNDLISINYVTDNACFNIV